MHTKKLLTKDIDSSRSVMQCLLPSFSFVLLLCVFVSISCSCRCSAQTVSDIRVGLTTLYGSKEHLSIYNNSVALGYCDDNTYSATDSFYSDSGFTFVVDKSNYYISPDQYNSYSSASAYIPKLKSLGMTAYPVSVSKSKWYVYILDNGQVPAKYAKYSKTSDRNSEVTIIHVTGTNGEFLIDSHFFGQFPQFKTLDKTALNLGTRSYRGRIEIIVEKNKLTAINIVSIEAYLLGVVTCEMDKLYPEEALKAQTVAARSYAIAKAGFAAGGTSYKLNDNTYSQVYKGIGGESEQARKAVSATIGEVIKNGNQIVEAFYFSTSGGSTDSISDIWGYSSSVYERVFDKYEKNPEYSPWVIDFSLKDIQDILKENKIDVGTINKIRPNIITGGSRVYSLKISGNKSSVTLDQNHIQDYFALPSAKFKIITSDMNQNFVNAAGLNKLKNLKISDCYYLSASGTVSKLSADKDQYILISDDNMSNIVTKLPKEGHVFFAGMGHGHGVGMSQSGAAGMAEEGYGYKDILNYYYNHVKLGKYYE